MTVRTRECTAFEAPPLQRARDYYSWAGSRHSLIGPLAAVVHHELEAYVGPVVVHSKARSNNNGNLFERVKAVRKQQQQLFSRRPRVPPLPNPPRSRAVSTTRNGYAVLAEAYLEPVLEEILASMAVSPLMPCPITSPAPHSLVWGEGTHHLEFPIQWPEVHPRVPLTNLGTCPGWGAIRCVPGSLASNCGFSGLWRSEHRHACPTCFSNGQPRNCILLCATLACIFSYPVVM